MAPALHVYQSGALRAVIRKQKPIEDSADPAAPWVLLHVTGRTDRFATQTEARAEALKTWGRVQFKKGTP